MSPARHLYAANRSPTGHATSILVTQESESGEWTYLPDEGPPRRQLAAGEPLYLSQEDAVLAARFRWKCKQGRPRGFPPTVVAIS